MKPNSHISVGILIAAIILVGVGAAFLSGGVYRVVNAGDGKVLLVNRFTGEARTISETRKHPEPTPRRAESIKPDEAELKSQRAKAIQQALESSGKVYSADPRLKVYHLGTCEMVSDLDVRTAVFFDNDLNALSPTYLGKDAGQYWPCQKCLPSETGIVIADKVATEQFPHGPAAFIMKKGDKFEIIGAYDEYYAVSSASAKAGNRSATWVNSQSVRNIQFHYGRDAIGHRSSFCRRFLSRQEKKLCEKVFERAVAAAQIEYDEGVLKTHSGTAAANSASFTAAATARKLYPRILGTGELALKLSSEELGWGTGPQEVEINFVDFPREVFKSCNASVDESASLFWAMSHRERVKYLLGQPQRRAGALLTWDLLPWQKDQLKKFVSSLKPDERIQLGKHLTDDDRRAIFGSP